MNDSIEPVLLLATDPKPFEDLAEQLQKGNVSLEFASTVEDFEARAASGHFSLILIDAGTLASLDLDLLERLTVPSLILARADQQDIALGALARGASDALMEPFSAYQILLFMQKKNVLDELDPAMSSIKGDSRKAGFSNLIAKSSEMNAVLDTVARLSNYSTTVLITGESGTGKELIARAIHNHSPRKGKPFIAINCGAIPENLIEAELFGYRKGSFTDAIRDKKGLLEEADGGTVFLDEVGEMPLHLQVKLLRALQERQIQPVGDERLVKIDVRLVAATLRDLEADIKAGRFREDLYYRLNVVSLHVPPLRSRIDDILPLAHHFVRKHAKRLGIPPKPISKEVQQHLLTCPWKGNVRELENCIERALVMSEQAEIDMASLPDSIKNVSAPETHALQELVAGDNLSIKEMTKQLEISLIRRALRKTRGNRTHAAKILEISHRALLYKMKEYGIKD